MKRVLVVIRSVEGYYRFVSPILDVLGKDLEVVLLAPDVNEFSKREIPHLQCVQRPVAAGRTTQLLRERYRGAMAYIYWSLLGVQKKQALDRAFGKKFDRALGKELVRTMPLRKGFSRIVDLLARLGCNQRLASVIMKVFRRLEEKTIDQAIINQVKLIAPDIILATPGIYPHTWEIDFVKAGRSLAIPTIISVASWDHLSGKGWLSVIPDRLLVWNSMQVQDARNYHAISDDLIVPVGAPSFDWLFDQRFLQARVDFCKQAGLDPARPFILWAASAPGNCLNEPGVVNKLIQEMRKYPSLNDYQVLVRPHPSANAIKWEDWTNSDASVWLTPGFPTDDEVKTGLYNSIAHATAIIGLSTSVFLEAGILDRPVALLRNLKTVQDAVFNKSLHFKYLLENHFPEAVENEVECARWLAQIAQGYDKGRDARHEFISRFLRPQGMDHSSTQVAVDAILELVKAN